MKKLTKLSALLLVAAVFFAGCKEPDDSTGANTSPLFSESDTTIEISESEIELSDGTWVYKEVTQEKEADAVDWTTGSIELEATVTDGEPTVTKASMIMNGTIPEGADIEEGKAYYEAQGLTFTVNGNKFTIQGEVKGQRLASYSSKFTNFYTITNVKTNEEKTKYYGTSENTYDDGFVIKAKHYLMKK